MPSLPSLFMMLFMYLQISFLLQEKNEVRSSLFVFSIHLALHSQIHSDISYLNFLKTLNLSYSFN